MAKKYERFVKPLIVRMGPEGLYPEMRIWMESRDLEGLNVIFSYGFIRNQGVPCHPVKGDQAVVHPYDEVLAFVGIDTRDITRLGGEISIEIGEKPEEYTFNEPTVVVIPRGTPHGPIVAKKLEMPIAHYLVGLAPEYKGALVPKKEKSTEKNYAHLVKKFKTTPILQYSVGLVDERGVIKATKYVGPGNADELIWIYGVDLGLPLNISWGFYSQCGIWHKRPGGGAHVHPVDEALIFVGLNPFDLYYLGAQVEFDLGEEAERHIINVPTAVIAPKGLVHCPEITWWVERPYGFIVLCLHEEHETHWLPTLPF
ncbi:MAG: hypothetical protein QXJ19_07390 [Candidatus Bathyarchaeia archaeon]|nr:hypothetical protein [Candidatus Bathyarchaeota archaeon]